MRRLLRRIRHWRDRDTLADEIETHRALSRAALERSGWPAADAARESRRRLGNTTLALEDARAVWMWVAVERVAADARYALRALRREPTFALTAIVTLALAVGASVAVFSVVDAAVWRPLPFPDADRLVAVFTTGPGRATHDRATGVELRAWQENAVAVEEIAAFAGSSRRVTTGDGVPESLVTLPVTANFFRALRMAPALGRLFEPVTDGDAGAAILTDACWRRFFAGNPDVIGRAVTLDGRPFTVVGVTAPDARLEFITSPDLFVTIDPGADRDNGSRRDLRAIGRLTAGATLDTATADLRTIAARLVPEQPGTNGRRSVRVEDLRAAYTGWNWRPLFFFLGAAAFVLLLASVNVASLLVARALRRQRELALRRALGGGTATIARQLLVEGAVLSAIGAAAGLLLAAWAVQALPAWLPPEYLGRDVRLAMDSRSLVAALGVTILTTLVFGCAPAAFNRTNLRQLLADGGRTVGGSRSQQRARQALVVVEVTIALLLVVGAGLFLNSFTRLTHMPLGFEPHERVTMRIPVSGPRYAVPGAVAALGDALLDQVRAAPGVRAAAIASSTPLGGGWTARFVVSGAARPSAGDEPGGIGRTTSPGYFRTLGIDLLAGRDFTPADDQRAPRVAIVNQHLVRRLFGGASPIGRVLEILPDTSSTWIASGPVEIVGLISNAKEVGLNEVEFNAIYFPFRQQPPSSIQLVVESSLPPAQVAAAVRRGLTAVAPDLPLYDVRTMDAIVVDALQSDRLNLLLIGTFAALATLMAGVGIYGAMSYALEQRTQEFGVRIALGAPRRTVLGLALGQSVRLGLGGTFLGLLAALLVARLAGTGLYLVEGVHEGLLYGVATTDPLTLTCACAALLLIATLAGLVPALRATRVDPIVALRRD